MPATSEPLDPLLHSLFVQDKKTRQGDPAPLAVLNQLLKTNEVTTEAVQTAYESLGSPPKRADEPSKESSQNKPAPEHRYRHVALRFYYDGAEYSGLAQNMGQESDKSVEKALFQALLKTRLVESRETSGYSRCGRTDKGVSAAGQVVALRLKSNMPLEAKLENSKSPVSESDLPKNESERLRVCVPPKKGNGPHVWKDVTENAYAKMLNGVLPHTIRILGWSPVSDDFSARFSATTRQYRYFFVKRRLQLDKMKEALQLLVGKHDFRNFCKMDVEKVYNFERLIHAAEIVECPEDGVCYIQILGQAFLWHQIRCIASILFLVGQGLEDPSVVKELLNVEEHPGKPGYPLAAERPLVLHHCGYPNLEMGHSTQNLWSVSCQMEQQWEELVLAAARVRNCVESLRGVTVMRQDVLDFTRNKLQDRIKKRNKHTAIADKSNIDLNNLEEGLLDESSVTWGRALDWMAQQWDCYADPDGIKDTAHIPLLQRSRGTTYEEKIEALSKSKRRQQKYEENVVKKRKTAEEDAAFYEHMTKQGGTGI